MCDDRVRRCDEPEPDRESFALQRGCRGLSDGKLKRGDTFCQAALGMFAMNVLKAMLALIAKYVGVK